MNPTFKFDLKKKQDRARAGVFSTPHGDIHTPVFAPVGTQAAVKAVSPAQLLEIGASLVLANTYHLYLRPGAPLIGQMGGLHKFMAWDRPILTDSGGFQVFSLAKIRKIDDEGVTFKSAIDGSIHRFTPASSIQVQEVLGGDIIMAFDECTNPLDRKGVEKAMYRTHAWAEECVRVKSCSNQALFGIVQGGAFPDFRQQSAKFIVSLEFPGYAIGGLSVGETKSQMHAMLDVVDPILPEDKPRYLMGVGSPEDILHSIARGIDIFDCVLPTRLARHQAAFTHAGRINLVNAQYFADPDPLEESCECYTCKNFSRAYLRHLIMAKEMLAATLVSIHNIHFLLELTRCSREAILAGNFSGFSGNFLESYKIRQVQ
jgi:queuine tRNA-ribosyltransferase